MTSWTQLRKLVDKKYKIADEQNGLITLLFDLGNDRSQMVFLWHAKLMGGREDWVQIESPIGKVDKMPFVPLMRETAKTICGGIGATGDMVTYRHSVPLENLDLNEFERPLMLVVSTADRLEHKLVGGDEN